MQVGISALNLVEKVHLCHNDIRPPNIAVSGDNFCLVDFDMSRTNVRTAVDSTFAPTMDGISYDKPKMMRFSVPQIILSVFMLMSPTVFSAADFTKAASVWDVRRNSNSKVDKELEGWVQSKGGILLEFVNALRSAIWLPALSADCKGFWTAVLGYLLR